MRTIIYKMTDDLVNDFCEQDIYDIDVTMDLVNALTQEEYADLCIDQIISDLIAERERCDKKVADNLVKIHNLMIFYYGDNLIDYKIIYVHGRVTGVVEVYLKDEEDTENV